MTTTFRKLLLFWMNVIVVKTKRKTNTCMQTYSYHYLDSALVISLLTHAYLHSSSYNHLESDCQRPSCTDNFKLALICWPHVHESTKNNFSPCYGKAYWLFELTDIKWHSYQIFKFDFATQFYSYQKIIFSVLKSFQRHKWHTVLKSQSQIMKTATVVIISEFQYILFILCTIHMYGYKRSMAYTTCKSCRDKTDLINVIIENILEKERNIRQQKRKNWKADTTKSVFKSVFKTYELTFALVI